MTECTSMCVTRQNGESVIITTPDGQEVDIQVRKIFGSRKVRLGITAPSDWRITRVREDQDNAEPLSTT
jgi:sRNA-binding carbon storage regulator CsrA